MCTRFYADMRSLTGYISEAQQRRLATIIMNTMSRPAVMSGEIRPTDMAAVIAPNRQGEPEAFPMIWGFTPRASSKPVINCRIETADQKDLWKDSWHRRRCIIPASWYYEWGILPSEADDRSAVEQQKLKKTKFAIQPKGSEITYLAGLYRFEEHKGNQIPVFAVITRESAAPVSTIHDRMPLILSEESFSEWIRPDGDPVGAVSRALTDLSMEPAKDPEKGQTGDP